MRDIIVIGAPIGGGALLTRLASEFPPDLDASVFVALHVEPRNPILLADVLNAPGRIRAAEAISGERIERRRIYVAGEGKHLILKDGTAHLSSGHEGNGHLRSIDALFTSAADAFGKRVVGVLLLHAREDGAAGLHAVRKAGGRTITQRNEQMPDAPKHPQTEELLSNFHVEIEEIASRVIACFEENETS